MTSAIRNRRRTSIAARCLRRAAAIGIVLATAGCALPPMETGRAPATSNLSSLVSGRSTEADVRAALGEPHGFGAARYRANLPKHKVWYYERLQMQGDQVGVHILLVMFRNDRYDGYLWFQGKELIKGPLS